MDHHMPLRVLLSLLVVALATSLEAEELRSGITTENFDRRVRPQDNLFGHVNGQWLQQTEIPADKSEYGSFTQLSDEAIENIHAIMQEAAAAETASGNMQRIGGFYRSFMNTDAIEQAGIAPLKPEFDAIDGLASSEDIVRHFGVLQTVGVDGPIGFFVGTDAKSSKEHLAAVYQSGTSLPDRDYYFVDDERYIEARQALRDYITTLFELAGLPGGAQAASDIVELETKLALFQWSRTKLRDANLRYNKYAVGDLPELTPSLPWQVFFAAVGTADLAEVNVTTPSYFQALEAIFTTTPVETWKQYMRFRVLDAAAPALPQGFVDASFELYQNKLAGVPEQKPRWERAVETASGGRGFGVLGDAIGEIYVQKHFGQEAKRRMDELVANLLKTYEVSIKELTWMTADTKQKALEKLHKITPKIGLTEKWRDYSNLQIDAEDLLGNLRRSALLEHQRMLDKLGKPVDETEWGMTPQTVNAYYNPTKNEIVFPAAILQPPFFDAEVEDAVNYGGIGAVIGHEISHGFDDQGSKYDGDGNLKNWWTESDRGSFEKLADALVSQYDAYEALPGKNVQGQLTLGENIADLSGLAIAYKAYRRSLGEMEGPVIDDFTADQRFFIGWAQIWARKYRDSELVRRLVTDPHSPSLFRANGPVANFKPFYRAFNVTESDRLFKPKAERIQIW
ncbi:MAG: M13 family metallopeptidase [Pirellulales bacterium]|nr:M13 family metallopeptidase [Pirellulales bacterium]